MFRPRLVFFQRGQVVTPFDARVSPVNLLYPYVDPWRCCGRWSPIILMPIICRPGLAVAIPMPFTLMF